MSGSADIAKAVVAAWNGSTLNTLFRSLQENPSGDFAILSDTEAEPSAPFPYATFYIGPGRVDNRASGGSSGVREERVYDLEIVAHAKAVGNVSAKAVAVELADAILAVYGGHPSSPPNLDQTALDYGHILICSYDTDFYERVSVENYAWHVRYKVRADVPAAHVVE